MANWFDLEEEKKPKAWFELDEASSTPELSTTQKLVKASLNILNPQLPEPGDTVGVEALQSAAVSVPRSAISTAGQMLKGIATLGEATKGKLDIEDATKEKRLFNIGSDVEAFGESIAPEYVKAGFLTKDVPEALGQIATFSVGGIAAQSAKLPAGVSTITLGAAQEAEGLRADAEAHGASPTEQLNSALWGVPIGATELLGMNRLIKNLDKAMHGQLSRGAAKLVKEAAVIGAENAAQEYGQTILENLVAKKFVRFDPDRNVFQGAKEAGEVGGASAILAQAIIHALGRVRGTGSANREVDEAKLPEWARMPPEPKGEADETGLPPEAPQQDVPFEQRELYPTQPSDYTLQTLQLLPAKPVIRRETIEQTLNRQDIKGVEKQLVKEVLETEFAGQQDIDRRAFESRVVEKLPGLSAVETKSYAEYGLENIGISRTELSLIPDFSAKTRIWSLPYKTSTDTHFGTRTPNYAVHTRSFTDAGGTTRSIVEVQSDVTQRKQRELTEQEREGLKEELAIAEAGLDAASKAWEAIGDRFISPNEINEILPGFAAGFARNERNVLQSPRILERHIEDIAERHRVYKAEVQNKLADKGPIKGVGEHLYTLALQEETRKAARDGIQTMRLGTPETVAKVEGWEKTDVPEYEESIAGLKKRYERLGKFVKKKYKAQEVTDEKGNTWLEWFVPQSAAVDPVMYYNRSLSDMANQPGRTRTVEEVRAQVAALRMKPTKAILGQDRSSAVETGLDLVYNRAFETIPTGEATFLGFEEDSAFIEKAKPQIDAWTKRFMPGRRVIVTDEQLLGNLRILNPQLFQSMDRSNGQAALLQDGTALIMLNSQRYRYLGNMDLTYARWLSTLAHEFGHNLAFAEFYRAPEQMRFEIIKDLQQIRQQMLDGTVEQAFARREGVISFFREVEFLPQSELSMPLVEYLAKHPEIDVDYWFSNDELLANQFVKAGVSPQAAMTVAQRFYNRVAALLERFYNYLRDGFFKPSPSYQKFLEHVARSQLQEQQAGGVNSIVDKLFSDESPTRRAERKAELDPVRYNWFIRQFAGLTDLVKLNPQVAPLQAYMNGVRSWWQEKSKWFARADERLHEWYGLGKDQSNRLAKLLLDETVEGKWYDMTDQRVLDKYGLQADAVTLYHKVKEDFSLVLDVVQQAMIVEAQRQLAMSPEALATEIANINTSFEQMRAKPYFPLPRFGKYTVTLEAHAPIRYQGKKFKLGERIVSFHESEADARREEQALKGELAKEFANKDVLIVTDKIPESAFSFQGIPPNMLDKLATVLNLDDQQRADLKQYTYQLSPANSWRKHMMKRQTVLGFSEDAMRGYAAYMFRAANHLARITHYRQLSQARSDLNDFTNLLRKKSSTDTVKARKLYEHVDRHMHYLMNPESEWEGARAFGFLWYLSAVPKAAFINLAQVPMATYPYLAARYGDATAVAEMSKALDTIRKIHLSPEKVSPDLLRMVAEGKAAGFLDESFASELAAVSEGSTLSRLLPETEAGRRLRQLSRIGSFLFHHAEKFNRLWTSVATYELARKAGMDHQKAFEAVRTAVESSQFEYSKWDRPELLRGKKSVLFLFKRYLIGMMWFIGRDPGSLRSLAIIFALAGLQGLPFAEDLMDLATWLMSMVTGRHFDAKRETREFVKDLGANPDLLLHGGMHNFAGFDLSQSLSLGDVVPGTKLLSTPGEFKDKLPMMLQEAGGPFVNIPLNLLQVAMDDNPDTWRRVERALPNFAKDMLQARRFLAEGAATSPRGQKLVEFDKDTNEAYWFATGKALGFTPSGLSKEYEKQRILRDATQYYMLRRQRILDSFWLATLRQDREALADARKSLRDYNAIVRNVEPMLYISGDTITRSIIERMMNVKKAEAGMAPELRYQHMYGKVNKLFEEGVKEVQSGVNDDK